MRKSIYLFVTLFSLIIWSSCDEKEPEVTEKPSADQAKMLVNYADSLILPSYNASLTSINSLITELDASDGSDLTDLRSKFQTAYINWQKCSFYNFGPGQGYNLVNNVNIYPVDIVTINTNITDQVESVANINADQKGFGTIDYLLFERSSLSTDELNYLKLVANEIKTRLDNTVTDWEGSYRDAFVVNGGYSKGSATSLLLNGFVQYFERNTRDGKLGIPLGIRNSGTQLPEKTEAFYSGLSNELLQANITAFKTMFNGGIGYGLDDLLKSEDSSMDEATADEISALWDEIETTALAINTQIDTYVVDKKTEGETYYSRIQRMLVLLKINTLQSLGTKVEYTDTDGD